MKHAITQWQISDQSTRNILPDNNYVGLIVYDKGNYEGDKINIEKNTALVALVDDKEVNKHKSD